MKTEILESLRSRFTFHVLLLFAALRLLTSAAMAQNQIITATLTVTNALGTTNGQTAVINGVTLTWTNSVVLPASQILTNATQNGAKTNWFNQLSTYPQPGLYQADLGTNVFSLQSYAGGPNVITLSAGWGTVTYATNTLTNAFIVRMPIGVETPTNQTNIASDLVAAEEESTTAATTNAFWITNNFDTLATAQTIMGKKIFTGSVFLSNAPVLLSPSITNGVNNSNAFSSPNGSWANSEQFGAGAVAVAVSATALGHNALAGGLDSVAIGESAAARLAGDMAIGDGASASAGNGTALGIFSSATGVGSTALGSSATSAYANSTAVGATATCTTSNQVMLGAATISVVVNNRLTVGGIANFGTGITNTTLLGTNVFAAGADVSFVRYSLSSLANGNNKIDVGTNVFLDVSGPTGPFSINGIASGRDGKLVILLNSSGQAMTIANDSGIDPIASERIYTGTGADLPMSGNPQMAILVYKAANTHWQLFTPSSAVLASSANLNSANIGTLTVTNGLGATNFVLNQLYTNNTGGPLTLHATAVLTPATISGAAEMDLMQCAQGGTAGLLDSAKMPTSIAAALSITGQQGLNGCVSNGFFYWFTNTSAGAGDSSSLVSGTGYTKQP